MTRSPPLFKFVFSLTVDVGAAAGPGGAGIANIGCCMLTPSRDDAPVVG